jgi:Flp pilus assembly protein TadG
MIARLIRDDTWGGTLVEATVTIPYFLALMFGLVQAGLLLWTKAGLQHGVEVATRCASVNYSANQLGLATSCFIVDGAAVAPSTVCGSSPSCDSATATPYIQKYAAQNSFGLVPSFSSFTVTQTLPPGGPCPTTVGYVVTASVPYNLINYIFSVTLTATSTFSINCS